MKDSQEKGKKRRWKEVMWASVPYEAGGHGIAVFLERSAACMGIGYVFTVRSIRSEARVKQHM